MLRNLIAILAGLLTGFITIIIVEMIGNIIYPAPPDIDFSNKEQVRVYIEQSPIGSLIFVLLSYAIGSSAGGYIACRVGKNNQKTLALGVGAILTFGNFLNLISIQHPTWFTSISLLIFIPFALLGFWIYNQGVKNT